MEIERKDFGRTHQDERVERVVLRAASGVSVALINYGATVQSVRVPDRNGDVDEITLGFDELLDYLGDHPYFGATVGRFANRIAAARFELDGRVYELATNDGPNHLHGGHRGFGAVVWRPLVFVGDASASVHFSHTSCDGEEGYPGAVEVVVVYTLTDAGELTIAYQATADAPTPLNLTNHCYWNLAGAGKSVLDHELLVNAAQFLPVDDQLIPTGELASVTGTPMDFRETRRLGARIDELGLGYDHCYVLADSRRAQPRLAAVLSDRVSGRSMTVRTTEPGLQVYTGNHLDGVSGADGRLFHRQSAVCLETQHFPNSPNEPAFPSTVLKPGDVYRHETVHTFSAR